MEAPAFVVIHTTSHYEGGGLWNRDVSSPWLSWFGCEKFSTALRSKDTSRVFCPSAPGTGRRRRLLVLVVWSKIPFLREGRLELLMRGNTGGSPPPPPGTWWLCLGSLSLSWWEGSSCSMESVISTTFPDLEVDEFWGAGPSYGALENEDATSWKNGPRGTAGLSAIHSFLMLLPQKCRCEEESSSCRDQGEPLHGQWDQGKPTLTLKANQKKVLEGEMQACSWRMGTSVSLGLSRRGQRVHFTNYLLLWRQHTDRGKTGWNVSRTLEKGLAVGHRQWRREMKAFHKYISVHVYIYIHIYTYLWAQQTRDWGVR